MGWTDNLQYIFQDKELYKTYINDVLKHKSWADPYYYETSDDEDWEDVPWGRAKKNWDQFLK